MSHLTINELAGFAARHSVQQGRFLKLYRRGAGVVSRPVSRGMSGLGSSDCGQEPETAAGEKKQCCPDVGWVVYDAGESEYGICERAQAASGGSSASSASSAAVSSEDPFARVEAMRRELEAKRDAREEAEFERQKQELQLRFVMKQMQAIQQQEASRAAAEEAAKAAKIAADAARARADADARKADLQREQNKKLLIGGVVAIAAAKLLLGAF